jgi:hypothetical protein
VKSRWALRALCVNGEELIGVVRLPQYLLYALTVLLPPIGGDALHPSCRAVLLGGLDSKRERESGAPR